MSEEIQEIERLIKQSAELSDSLIRLARQAGSISFFVCGSIFF
jgi:hypothetical protein